jgi:hypothetical protein
MMRRAEEGMDRVFWLHVYGDCAWNPVNRKRRAWADNPIE